MLIATSALGTYVISFFNDNVNLAFLVSPAAKVSPLFICEPSTYVNVYTKSLAQIFVALTVSVDVHVGVLITGAALSIAGIFPLLTISNV